ncbi:MAG TPA: hypothetical protein PKE30_11060 [Niabella sp.]|nr:hypothetical protein [Niabella sp.]
MLSEKEIALLYETLLSAPGMDDVVKIDIRMPRKAVLLLSKVIGKGLEVKPGEALSGLLKAAGEGSDKTLLEVSAELLQKAGLTTMNEKLLTLQPQSK